MALSNVFITQHKYAPCCLSEICNSNTLSKHCFLRYSDANLVYTSGKSCLRNRAVINNNKDSWWSDLLTTVTAIVPHSRRPPSLMRSSARRLPQPSHQRQQGRVPPASVKRAQRKGAAARSVRRFTEWLGDLLHFF